MASEETVMPIITEIGNERLRQIQDEGFDAQHDDTHKGESLAMAAACYAAPSTIFELNHRTQTDSHYEFVDPWPWARRWDGRGVKDRRRQLVIAAALIVAEIERLDRAAAKAISYASNPELVRADLTGTEPDMARVARLDEVVKVWDCLQCGEKSNIKDRCRSCGGGRNYTPPGQYKGGSC